MNILALDSSGLVASVALLTEEKIIGEYTINHKQTHSQTLLPMLSNLVEQLGVELKEIDFIAISEGPGSFTGLRIGAATAKGLGLALNRPLVSVPTLEAMAQQLWGVSGNICPIMDARRNQVYTGVYEFLLDETLNVIKEQCAISIEELICWANKSATPITFLGDGVEVHRDYIQENITVEYKFAPMFSNRQRGAALGVRALEYIRQEKIQKASEHNPNYLRQSQAERERLEREGK